MMLYVPNLVQLIGLGLAVDYSLLVVHRFREELAAPDRPVEDAVVATMASAGRTVLVSAAAVALGLGVVVIVPVPFVRSLGIAGILVPAVSVGCRAQPAARAPQPSGAPGHSGRVASAAGAAELARSSPPTRAVPPTGAGTIGQCGVVAPGPRGGGPSPPLPGRRSHLSSPPLPSQQLSSSSPRELSRPSLRAPTRPRAWRCWVTGWAAGWSRRYRW